MGFTQEEFDYSIDKIVMFTNMWVLPCDIVMFAAKKEDLQNTFFRKEFGFCQETRTWLVVWNMNFICPDIGNVIIPTDFHIFLRG